MAQAVQTSDPTTAARFGRYELLSELGRGAMGIVYLARDPKIERLVAIKTISFAGKNAREHIHYRDRFLVEAKAAGRLSHRGIVSIYDFGEDTQTHTPYIVMEYVSGHSLERMLALSPGGIPVMQALTIVKQVAEALDYAHRQKVIHRDIKPANIVIAPDGQAKVTDFGVARIQEEAIKPGVVSGTPAFMSPEQVTGAALDGRSDLFSLGVVLYTIVVGYRPFQGSGNSTVSFKVLNRDPVPVSIFKPTLIAELDLVIDRAMEKDPAHRYQSGAEMAADLSDLLDGRRPRSCGPLEISSTHFTFMEAIAPHPKSELAARIQDTRSAVSSRRRSRPTTPAKRNRGLLLASCLLVGVITIIALGYRAVTQESNDGNALAPDRPSPPVSAHVVPPVATSNEPAAPANKNIHRRNPTGTLGSGQLVPVPRTNATFQIGTVEGRLCLISIHVEHSFKQAHMSVLIDGELASEIPLFGLRKSQFGLFRSYKGEELAELKIPAGTHALSIEVHSEAEKVNQSRTIAGNFVAQTTKVLRIRLPKGNQPMRVELLDPLPSVAAGSNQSTRVFAPTQ